MKTDKYLRKQRHRNALFNIQNAVPNTVINKQTHHAKSISTSLISDQ